MKVYRVNKAAAAPLQFSSHSGRGCSISGERGEAVVRPQKRDFVCVCVCVATEGLSQIFIHFDNSLQLQTTNLLCWVVILSRHLFCNYKHLRLIITLIHPAT